MRAAPKRSVLPPLDENGLLLDPHLWDESIAQALADHHGVGPLGTEHWQVISALRACSAIYFFASAR